MAVGKSHRFQHTAVLWKTTVRSVRVTGSPFTPPWSIQPFSAGAKCFATSGNTFSLSALSLPLTPFSLGCVTALVLYYWNVWLWLVQQMKRLNANVWFPRGPPGFMGCRCLHGRRRAFKVHQCQLRPAIVCILCYSSGQVNTKSISVVPVDTRYSRYPVPPSPACGVWAVKTSQALNMRNVGSTRTSPWLYSSE